MKPRPRPEAQEFRLDRVQREDVTAAILAETERIIDDLLKARATPPDRKPAKLLLVDGKPVSLVDLPRSHPAA